MKNLSMLLVACLATSPVDAATPLTRAVQQAYDAGFRDCAPTLDRFVRFIHEDDTQYGFYGIWSKDAPNASMFSTTTTEITPAGNMVTTFSAVKNNSGTCDVSVSTTVVSTSSCAAIRESTFKDWKFYGDLNGSSIYSDPTSQGDDVILTNIPNNYCLLVKRLSAYGVPK